MDEIFGEGNFVYQLSVVNKLNGNDNSSGMMETQEYCLIFAKNKINFKVGVLTLQEDDSTEWKIDEIGYWKEGGGIKATGIASKREDRPNLFYPLYINENTLEFSLEKSVDFSYEIFPKIDGDDGRWTWKKEKFIKDANEVIIKKVNGGYSVYKKQRPQLGDLPSKRGKTTFYNSSYSTANSSAEIKKLFDGNKIFDYSKSTNLIKDLISIANVSSNDIILDSFAGSGTTAHAVLDLNKEDGGNRKFILVEMEDYANNITAERVRRVINGVPTAKDEKLKQGLGGSFTFCTLGDEFNIEKILTGETLPKYEALANYVFYTATGKSLEMPAKQRIDYFVGETDLYEVYLIYQPDIAFLRSNESALNAKMVKIISARESKKTKLVFASAKYMGQNELNDHKIIFCQLPYAIHKITIK